MSSKIELNRELIDRIVRDGSLSVATHDQLRQALDHPAADHCEDALGMAAPVVERQPDAYIVEAIDEDGHLRRRSLHWQALEVFKDMRNYKEWIGVLRAQETPLYTAPPELAGLQSTIARLTAENERLKTEQKQLTSANHRQAMCIHLTAQAMGPEVAATVDALPKAARHLASEIERLKGGQGEPVALITVTEIDREYPSPSRNVYVTWLNGSDGALSTGDKLYISLDRARELNP